MDPASIIALLVEGVAAIKKGKELYDEFYPLMDETDQVKLKEAMTKAAAESDELFNETMAKLKAAAGN